MDRVGADKFFIKNKTTHKTKHWILSFAIQAKKQIRNSRSSHRDNQSQMKAVKMHENRNNNMESFYEENGQFVVTTAQSTRNTRNLKRPESLDLHLAINNNRFADKKARCAQSGAAVLATPDVNKMIWGTPDLEKYIMSLPTPVFANNAVKVDFEQFAFFFL